MLIDNVNITIKAGNGGNGIASFLRNAMTAKGGPDGGNGGNGGDVYIEGSANVNDLREFRFTKTVNGENGGNGTNHNGFGRNGTPITIFVPLGTRVTDLDTGSMMEIDTANKKFCIARGGKGGLGNYKFKSSTNQAPKDRELGILGEEKHVNLELRIIAEIGLIGLPNAGKSSLLAALTNATPAIGDYPFTTLEPNIGMFGRHAIADIPGLIEGASQGKGLGLKFLKHIEKTRMLIHCIDITDPNPMKAYETVRMEFKEYNPILLEKPELIFLNKTDLVSPTDAEKASKAFAKLGKPLFTGSTRNEEDVKRFRKIMADKLAAAKE